MFALCFSALRRLQCCGLRLEDAQSVVSHRPDLSRVVDTQSPLTSLDNAEHFPGNMDMLTDKRPSDTYPVENGLGGCNKPTKTHVGIKSTASIRDKISQWEGKTDSAGPNSQSVIQKETESVRKKDIKTTEVQRRDSKRGISCDRQDIGKENGNKIGESRKSSEVCTRERDVILEKMPVGKTDIVQDKKSVLTHIKKLEQAMKETPTKPSLPGNYFCPPFKDKQEETEKKAAEPIFGTVEVVRAGSRRGRNRDPENVYTEPGAPSINPLPKPQRTFQHHTQTNNRGPPQGSVKGRRNLPPLPSIPPPPLPSCPPPPGVCQRPWQERTRDSNNR